MTFDSPLPADLHEVAHIDPWVTAAPIRNADDAQDAARELEHWRRLDDRVVEYWKDAKAAAHKAHAEVCAKERQMRERVQARVKLLTNALVVWRDAEAERERQRLAEEAVLRAQALADDQQQQATALEQMADAAGLPELREEARQMREQPVEVAVAQSRGPQVAGVGFTERWVAEVIDEDEVRRAAARFDIYGEIIDSLRSYSEQPGVGSIGDAIGHLLDVRGRLPFVPSQAVISNASALSKLANLNKGKLSIPGVAVRRETGTRRQRR